MITYYALVTKKFVRIQSIVSKGERKQKLAFLADLSAKVLTPKKIIL